MKFKLTENYNFNDFSFFVKTTNALSCIIDII